MDFIDVLKQFSSRVEKMKDQITTEEATKMALILPFFQILGYDVFNPNEFIPEFVADVGIKKGEKVDYAITFNGEPTILLEAKWCGESLDVHSSQLFRYFGTTKAKFAILTNGLIYRFFTDLDESNKMDLTPFLEFDLLNIKDVLVPEIKKFHKDNFDVSNVFSTASELKYSKLIKDFFLNQLKSPEDDFIRFLLSKIYDGTKTQSVVDKFNPIVKKSLNDFITELMNDKIKAALKNDQKVIEPPVVAEEVIEKHDEEVQQTNKIITTDEEMQAYYIIKSILSETIEPSRISYKDTTGYFGILLDNKATKWICRLRLSEGKKTMFTPLEDDKAKINMESIEDLYKLKSVLVEACNKHIEKTE